MAERQIGVILTAFIEEWKRLAELIDMAFDESIVFNI